MADKVTELEERLNRLEEKLKVTFTEIEKRLMQQPQQQTDVYEDRLQELEDLILLLQLENTKLKDKVGEGLDFGIAPSTPDIRERLNTIEGELASHTTPLPASSDVDAKIAVIEERINSLQTPEMKVPKDMEKHLKTALAENIRDLEKRIKTLEALLAQRGHEELEKESTLLADVNSILKR